AGGLMKLTRKEFLSSVMTAAAGAAGAAILVACSSNSGSVDATPGNCLANGTRVSIGSNHGHVMAVSAAEVTAGASKTYDITGGATHGHNVTITASLFTMLQANTAVTATSTA